MSGCTVCAHPQLAFINAAMEQSVSLRALEESYGLSRSALSRHQAHNESSVSPPHDAPTPAAASQPPAAPVPAATAGPLPKTRLRTCPVCQCPDAVVERLDEVLSTREPSESLAMEYGLGLNQLLTHAQHRASEAVSRQRYEAEQHHQAPADDPGDPTRRLYPVHREITDLVAAAEQLHQQALRAAGLAPALFVLRAMGALLVKLAERVSAGEER